jgi:hypothetical protein
MIEEGVLDEDRTFRSKDAVEEGLPDLVGLRARLVLDHPRRGNAHAARRCLDYGVEGPEVRSAAKPPALAEDPVQVPDDRSLEPNEAVMPLPPGLRLTGMRPRTQKRQQPPGTVRPYPEPFGDVDSTSHGTILDPDQKGNFYP